MKLYLQDSVFNPVCFLSFCDEINGYVILGTGNLNFGMNREVSTQKKKSWKVEMILRLSEILIFWNLEGVIKSILTIGTKAETQIFVWNTETDTKSTHMNYSKNWDQGQVDRGLDETETDVNLISWSSLLIRDKQNKNKIDTNFLFQIQ